MARYSEIRESLKTGDLVLFSGVGRVSKLIQYFTKSIYSHIGICVCHDDLGVLLLESTTLSNLPDLETGQPVKGVQLVTLSDRIQTYNGLVAVRQLREALTPEQQAEIAKLRREVRGLPYEKNKLDLLFAAVDWWDIDPGDNADLDTLFCSELVAEAYKRVKLLPPKIPADEYTPANFAKGFNDILSPVEAIQL